MDVYAKLKLCSVEVVTEEVGFDGGFEGRECFQFPNVAR